MKYIHKTLLLSIINSIIILRLRFKKTDSQQFYVVEAKIALQPLCNNTAHLRRTALTIEQNIAHSPKPIETVL